jgi:hypothetical protein
VIQRITRERQPPALDRVREDDRWLLARPRGCLVGLEDEREVVTADIRHK